MGPTGRLKNTYFVLALLEIFAVFLPKSDSYNLQEIFRDHRAESLSSVFQGIPAM